MLYVKHTACKSKNDLNHIHVFGISGTLKLEHVVEGLEG